MELLPIFKKAYWLLAASGLLYLLAVLSLTHPGVQRGYLFKLAFYYRMSHVLILFPAYYTPME